MGKPYATLNNEAQVVHDGMDSIVIRQFIAGVKNGKTLDVTGFEPEVIKAGHIVIYDKMNDAYKPMPINETGDGYASLPSNHEYVGVVVCSVSKKHPIAGIMYAGEVNDVASPYRVENIKTDIKTALPQLVFMHD